MGRTGGWLRVLVLSMLTGPGGEAATRTRMRTQSKSNKPQLCQIHISVTVSMHTVLCIACPHLLTRYSNCSNDISFVSVGCPFFWAILHQVRVSPQVLAYECILKIQQANFETGRRLYKFYRQTSPTHRRPRLLNCAINFYTVPLKK